MGARFSAPVQTGPGTQPTSCKMGTGSFPGVKSCRGVKLTPHTLLVPWSYKSRAIPLLPLWVVRPVQSLSACTRVHFTLPYLLTPWSRVLLEKLTSKLAKKFPAFVEPESPSPYTQMPANCPYPEPAPSSPHDPLQLPEDPS